MKHSAVSIQQSAEAGFFARLGTSHDFAFPMTAMAAMNRSRRPSCRSPANREQYRGERERFDTPDTQNLDSTGLS
jgi:hypothetical protein